MASILTIVGPVQIKRTYPHVGQVPEWATSQTIRLLWDRVWDLEGRLQAAEINIRSAGTVLDTMNTTLLSTTQLARQAYALAQDPTTSPSIPGDPPSGGDPPCPDDGEAGAGVADAGPTGDIGVTPLDAYHAGLIIGGTANEFPLLTAPAIDEPTRENQNEELVRRMIWHLNQAGYVAGRQRNPSSAISKDKLTVEIGGETFAYDVFQGVDFDQQVPIQANRVCPADYVADAGIPD